MRSDPLISIVVPVLNQVKYLGEALRSLVEQDYSALEVIIQDGESNDGSAAVAEEMVRRNPEAFRLFVEKDLHLSDALNRGFARAKGEILGYLSADDLLLPRSLHRVAAEVAPDRGRHVVMGRSVYLVEGMGDIGVAHPAEYLGLFDHLAIWKRGFNAVPQPSVFWHRSVQERVGAFAADEPYAVDYDLVCRMGRYYEIHNVDCAWSACRIHGGRASARRTDSEMVDTWIGVSRRYWGSWLSPLRWQCEASYWLYNRHLHEHARHHARLAENAAVDGHPLVAQLEFLKTWIYSPAMARGRYRRGLDRKS